MIDNILREIKKIGINQISKQVLKDWFADRPYIDCTIVEVLKAAEKAEVAIKPSNIEIPSWFMPINQSKMASTRESKIERRV